MTRTRTRLAAVLLLALPGCRREEREFRPAPSSAETLRWTRMSDLQPGPEADAGRSLSKSNATVPSDPVKNPYQESAFAVSEGKRLYSAFNCVGCHARGGGGMGPPLMDDSWLYGSDPEQVFSTIVEGRPNGMPRFGARIPEYQIWWLVAYVRSMSGLGSSSAAPGRSDEMSAGRPENSREKADAKNSSLPKSAEMPQ